jgi:hypothetical protein
MIIPDYDRAMYLLRNEKNVDLFLYYYTSDSTFFKMLDNLRIKTSKFNEVNDLDEANFDYLGGYWIKNPKIREYINNKCRFISFVHDEPLIEGTSHPRMWAQYANNNKGVCLVLNRERVLNECKKRFGEDVVMIGDINYTYSKLPPKELETEIADNCKKLDVEDIIKKYYEGLLLTKHADWEQEFETRLLLFGEIDWLPIDGCIEGICLGRKFVEDIASIARLIETISSENFKYKGYITKDALGLVTTVDGGYTCESIRQSFQISNLIGRNNKTLSDFQKA